MGEKFHDIYTNAHNMKDMVYKLFTIFVVGNGILCWQLGLIREF